MAVSHAWKKISGSSNAAVCNCRRTPTCPRSCSPMVKWAAKPQVVTTALTLDALCERYVEIHSNGAMERNSLDTVEMHLRHFRRTLGDDFAVSRLRQDDLQSHLTRRSKQKGHP